MSLQPADLTRLRRESQSRAKAALKANDLALFFALIRLDFRAFDKLAGHRAAFRRDAARASAPAYCPAILED